MDMILFFIGFFTGIVFMAFVSVGTFYAMKMMFNIDFNKKDQEELSADRKRDKVRL